MDDKPIILKPDNIYFELYQLLWFRTNKSNKNQFSFRIPDTILFKDNVPYEWIFTSKSGYIKRKHKDKLNIKEIIKKFYNETTIEVIGHYLYLDAELITLVPEEEPFENNPLFLYFKQLGIDMDENKEGILKKKTKNLLKFEILNRQTFKDFIHNFKKRNGILQIYIESNFDPNTQFKVLWSKNRSICEMRNSRFSFNAQNAHSYEKVVTYETEKFNIHSSNLIFILERVPSIYLEKRLVNASQEVVNVFYFLNSI